MRTGVLSEIANAYQRRYSRQGNQDQRRCDSDFGLLEHLKHQFSPIFYPLAVTTITRSNRSIGFRSKAAMSSSRCQEAFGTVRNLPEHGRNAMKYLDAVFKSMVQSWSTNPCRRLLNALLGATRVAYFHSVTS
jgi:hypothetical protein